MCQSKTETVNCVRWQTEIMKMLSLAHCQFMQQQSSQNCTSVLRISGLQIQL